MALLQVGFHSDTLMRNCEMTVIMPQKVNTQIGMTSSGNRRTYPVLYLLHGCSDDCSTWLRRTSIERYAAQYDLVVVMPGCDRSYYTNMKHGYKYFDFLTDELPRIVESFFPVSTKREDTFIGGLSMGGYGALKAALTRPQQYCFAGALSGVTDIVGYCRMIQGEEIGEKENIFGPFDQIAGGADDLFYLLQKAAASGTELPIIRQYCGKGDFLYELNQNFRKEVQKSGKFDYKYKEAEGAHTWEFWDEHVQEMLRELPLQKNC